MLKVIILNWEKIQTRRDIKSPSWFAFKNKFFEDSEFFSFTNEEKLAWLYLLCESSKQNKAGVVTVDAEHFHRITMIPSAAMKSSIKKLKQLRIIEVRTYGGRYASVRDPYATRQDKTEQDKTEQDKTEQESSDGLAFSEPDRSPSQSVALQVWDSYQLAYRERYGSNPVRNATVNSQIKSLVGRLGREAPDVVDFYVKHNQTFYVRSCHPIGLCLKDAEALRTQWSRGRAVMNSEATRVDSAQMNINSWDYAAKVLAERKGKKNESGS